MKVFDKLFYQDAYAVGIRKINPMDSILSCSHEEYKMLMPTENEWYADSFCFSENGHIYLFMEIMGRNGNKGTLGVAEYFPDGGFSRVTEILREQFHLSYPNVFKYKTNYYMLPETHQAQQLRLYESTSFPYKWKLKKVLLEGVSFVDTSILSVDGNEYILYTHDISKENGKIRLYRLDLDKMTVSEIMQNNRLSNERPGGNTIYVCGKAYRVLQDCGHVYGEKLKIYALAGDNGISTGYDEELVGEIKADTLVTDIKRKFTRIHTLTRCGEYEAVDTLYKKFYYTKPFKGFVRIVKRRIKGE